MSLGRSRARVSAAVAAVLVAATTACGVIALSSDATASRLRGARSHPAIAIVNGPTVQTLDTKIVAKVDAKTHTRRPKLALGTAKFTITVTNTSPVRLTHVTVTDPLSPGCNRNIGTLAPGVAVAYFCSAANVGRDYTNMVTVSGRWPKDARVLAGAQGAAAPTATATATVKVKKPPTKSVNVPHLAFTG